MTLYEIKDNYLNALENLEVNEDGEITNLDVIEQAEGEFKDKAEAVACYIKSLEADAKALKEEIENLTARMNTKKNRAEKLRDYLAFCMEATNAERIETSKCNLFFRKSSRVIIDDESTLDEKYVVTKTTTSIAKSMIKDDIMAGMEVAGAHVEVAKNLQIK